MIKGVEVICPNCGHKYTFYDSIYYHPCIKCGFDYQGYSKQEHIKVGDNNV